MSIEQNIADKKLFDMVVEEAGPRFWNLCHERLFESVVEEEETELMTREQIKRFETQKMEFGAYKGIAIGNLNLDYLRFIASGIIFLRKLNKYLRSIDR